MPQIRLLNCFWLLVPVLAWDLILMPKLTQEGFRSEERVAKWVLGLGMVLRIVVFAYALLLPLQVNNATSRAGLLLYAAGLLIYFVSWVPLLRRPDSRWSRSAAGLMAPYVTPGLILAGIALVGNSWIYLVLSASFVAVHSLQGVQSHDLLTRENRP